MATSPATPPRQRFLGWLEVVGEWALAAPFFIAGMMFVVFLPAAAAVWLAEWTFSTGSLALEVAAVTVLMILTSAGLWWAFTGRRVAERLRFGRFEPTVRTLIVAFFAVASFASLTSLLYLEGALAISRPIDRENLIYKTSEVYVWHLFDTVPLLDIPQNLAWKLPFEFEDRIGGLLLIVFTAIVILPLIQVVRAIAAGYRQPYEEAVLTALRRHLPGWRTRPLRGEYGNERAIVVRKIAERRTEEQSASQQAASEQATPKQAPRTQATGREKTVEREERILVDVMQDVSTEDAPLRRLDFVRRFLAPTHGATGYVLVVDAVGERARDGIGDAFERSDFPSALAVWRSDQPGVHLAQVVEHLAKRSAFEAVLTSLQRGLPGWQTKPLQGNQDYELAIVEEPGTEGATKRFLVDVMRTVSPEDAPLRRLEAARDGLASMFDANGYLLVVDSVSERSREEIEEAFADSNLPAELIVWRSDLPSTHLAQAVEGLRERIPAPR